MASDNDIERIKLTRLLDVQDYVEAGKCLKLAA